MKIATWLLYLIAAACITVGLVLLSPPLALVALGLVLGRVAILTDKEGDS